MGVRLSKEVTIDQVGAHLRIQFLYDEDLVETVKLIPGRKYDKPTRSWHVPPACLPFVLAHFPAARYVGKVSDEAKRLWGFWAASNEKGRVFDQNGFDPPGRPLLAFQRAGVAMLSKLDRALLGDQMGLGKSMAALVLAQLRSPKRVLILCRADLKRNWAKELQLAYPGEFCGGFESMAKWVIESYDTVWRERALKTLLGRTFDVCILDEIQMVKSLNAKRSQGVYQIVERIPVRYGLTGTPMENRPLDLPGVLIALGYLTPGARWGFQNRYCDPEETYFGTNFNGASNLKELHRVLKFFMVRRLKEDVLQDLPAKIYTDDVFDLSVNSSYWKAEEDYKKFIRDIKSGKVGASKLARHDALLELGRQSALAKVDVAEERVRAALDSGLKVLFFSTFRDPIKELASRFGPSAVSFTGEMAPEDRARLVEKFQSNEFIRALFATTGAGGTGFNLTAAKIVMFLDIPWNPSKKEQAEDRAHRIGQDRGLQVVNLIAKDTIDERMVWLNAQKHLVISQAIDGEAKEFEGSEGLLEELEGYYAA